MPRGFMMEKKPELSKARPTPHQISIIKKLLILFKIYPVLSKDDDWVQKYSTIPFNKREHRKGPPEGKGRGISYIKYNFNGLDDLLSKLVVFDIHSDTVSISRPKLLYFLLQPLLETPVHNRINEFKKINGFEAQELCNYCNSGSLEQLLSELVSPPTTGSSQQPIVPTSFPFPLGTHSTNVPPPKRSLLGPPLVTPPPVPQLPSYIPLNQPRGHHQPYPVTYHPPFLPPNQPPMSPHLPPNQPPMSPHLPPYSHSSLSSPHSFSNKRPAVPMSPAVLPQDEAPPPIKRSSHSPDDVNNKSQPVKLEPETSQSSLKVSPSSVLTFVPSEAPSHYPNPNIHPRDIIHTPSLTTSNNDNDDIVTLNKPVSPRFSRKETTSDIITKVNTYLSMFIGYFSSQGKHLPLKVVDGELRHVLNKARQPTGKFIDYRSIECMKNFDMLYKRISEFIKVFCWHSPITTLFELQRILTEFEKVSDFRDLKLGPLFKHPDVVRLFQVPEDLRSVPEITAYDIHSKLFGFLNMTKRQEKHKVEDFLTHLTKVFNVVSPLYLCIRITSFPLACQINFKFRTSQRRTRERMELDLEKKISEELDFEINKWKKTLRRMSDELPKELERKDPIQLLESLLNLSLKYFPSQLKSRVMTFIQLLSEKVGLRKLFLLSIYEGVYGVVKINHDTPTGTTNTGASNSGSLMTAAPLAIPQHVYRSQSELHNQIIRYLKNLKFPISLTSLAEIEQKLLTEFGATSFDSFSHGSFMTFLTKHHSILTALGGSTISGGGSGKGSGEDKQRQGKRQQILMCIKQIKNQSNHDIISDTLRDQFQVDTISQLNCGELDKLITDSQQSLHEGQEGNISYLSSLLANSSSNQVKQESLTHLQTDPLIMIQNAPLLTDINSWCHWDLLYKSSLGPLNIYLQQHNISCLCVSPGVYLKINPNSSLGDFTNALTSTDPITTAGHLVSLTVRAGCIENVSTQLLAQHVGTKLTNMCTVGLSPELFILQCLVCMPLELAAIIGKQVFLDPLRRLTGTVNVDSTLLTQCTDIHQRRFLHSLGMKLGVKIWIDDYKDMITTKPCLIHNEPEMMETGSTPITSGNLIITKPQLATATTATNSDTVIQSQEQDMKELQQEGEKDKEKQTEELNTCTVTNQECQEIIESIRRDEFGIGLEKDLDERQKSILDKQKNRLGRSLQRLSEELYSKDTHFVLELVQNADDNTYPSNTSNSLPSLKFSLTKSCITVLNNEIGFMERNIRAICDVGKSTKDRHNSGYIGQKGIGFKSVFRVTENPEIHSRGFRIRFDISLGDPMGYILPQWIEDTSQYDILDINEKQRWTTRIILPLKTDHSLITTSTSSNNSNISQNMMNKFQDIQPSLLLFLNRLRCIIIEDKDSSVVHEMTRYDKDNGIIEIHHHGNIDKWLVVRRILTGANQYKLEVSATELALAFPLPDDIQASLSYTELGPQQVFAYLPLRSYGFRFIVQGDFDLPSSREDVNSNSAWNQWLREGIPQLFMTAINSFKSLPNLSQVQAMLLILNFIPLEGEIHDFFAPVTREILRLVKGSECFPTDPSHDEQHTQIDPMNIIMSLATKGHLNNNDDESCISWKQPSQLLYVKHPIIRDCIPQTLLTSSLKLHYLNAAMTSRIKSHLCTQLDIGTIDIDHLIGVAEYVLNSYYNHSRDNFANLMTRETNETSDYIYEEEEEFEESKDGPYICLIKWLSLWLACVHVLYEEDNVKGDVTILNKLKEFPIVPLLNGTIVSLKDTPVFFPPVSNKSIEQSFQPIYSELHTVHHQVYSSSSSEGDNDVSNTGSNDVTSARVFSLLSLLGVKDLNFNDIIYHHIIPQFKSDTIMEKKDKSLILYLAFIKHSIDKDPSLHVQKIISDLRESVLLVTNQGRFKPTAKVIHFDPVYKCQWNLSKIFPCVNWIMVSPKYSSFSDGSNWREFLSNLGVQSELTVERINRTLSPSNAEAINVWNISKWKRSPDGQYTLHDYCCQDFDSILQSIQSLSLEKQSEQLKILAEIIDKSWDTKYSVCTLATYYDGSDSNKIGTVQSTFGRSLLKVPWLPAVNGLDYKPLSISLSDQLYQMNDKLKRLLHSHVPYLGADIKSLNLTSYLNIKTHISPIELVNLLCQWSDDVSFTTSLEHMRNVYIYLSQQIDNESPESSAIFRNFKDKMLIFVPSITQWKNPSTDVKGTFESIQKTYWNDKTTVLFDKLKSHEEYPSYLPQILGFYYSSSDETVKRNIKHAFTNNLGVAKDIGLEHLIEILDYNSSLCPSPSNENIDSFRSISEAIVYAIKNEGTSQEFNQGLFLNKIKESKIFPSKGDNWVSLEGLYFDDDNEISKYFCKHDSPQKVHFLNWPGTQDSSLIDFLHICHIPFISKEVKLTLNPAIVRPYNDLKITFHYIIPLLQQYLFTNFTTEKILIEHYNSVAQTLLQLQFLSTLELICTYSLSEHYYANATLKQCMLQESSTPVVYVVVNEHSDIVEKMSLVDVICKLVLPLKLQQSSRKFSQFVVELLLENPRSEDSQKRFVEKYRLKSLLPEIVPWTVELPLPVVHRAIETKHDKKEESKLDNERIPLSENNSVPSNIDKESSAWPPRAPIRMSSDSDDLLPLYHKPNSSSNTERRKVTDSDVITMRDVRNIKSEEEKSESSGHLHHKRQDDYEHEIKSNTSKETSTYKTTSSDHHSRSSNLEATNTHERTIKPLPLKGSSHSNHFTNESASNNKETSDGDTGSNNDDQHQQSDQVSSSTHHSVHTFNKTNTTAATITTIEGRHKPVHYNTNIELPSIDMTTLLHTLTFEHRPNLTPQNIATGRWGEEYIYNLFTYQKSLPNGLHIVNIDWVNQNGESLLPYDIKVTVNNDSDMQVSNTDTSDHNVMETQEVYFVEVKSTQTPDKNLVPISWNEIKFAQEKGRNYLLIRVYNACTVDQQVQIKWLLDLSGVLEGNPALMLFLHM